MSNPFDYETAFSRNIGWVTGKNSNGCEGQRIAIAGLGGVGGVHAVTLARLGVEKFNISDFDRFEPHNSIARRGR